MTELEFYKNSLIKAEEEILCRNIALKDNVGNAYENHRKRVWEYFGCNASKDRHNAAFKVDWSITYKGKLIAFEEDKGHYLDACFLERALTSFAKTINNYIKLDKECPILILNSFTCYNGFVDKKKEFMEILNDKIKTKINEKLIYNTLTYCDRIKKTKWFGDINNAYSSNAQDVLILEDIDFIKSLVNKYN
jgi:hypothetical protein